MPRQDPRSAVAAAKLVVSQRRRKSLVAVEDRRRRRVAFEETAKGMLRYLDDSEYLKFSVTELQEQQGISEEAGVSMKQIVQQARNENWPNDF